eukprot:756656-Hanusia_phi.AAC.2
MEATDSLSPVPAPTLALFLRLHPHVFSLYPGTGSGVLSHRFNLYVAYQELLPPLRYLSYCAPLLSSPPPPPSPDIANLVAAVGHAAADSKTIQTN